MNIHPAPESTHSHLGSALKNAPVRLVRSLIHNWPWKLLALFLALCMWAGLISQDTTLTRERTFSDVPLNVTGVDTLRRNNGLIVLSGLDTDSLNVRMRVEVPQREYANVTYSNYNPRLDLTRVTSPGEQTLKVVTTSSSTYGTVEDVSPATIDVVVDEYVTNYRVPVSVNVVGEYPDGYYVGAISRDPSIVAVSGPKTVVDQIARVTVDYRVSSIAARAGVVRTAVPIRFFDADDNEIQSDLLEVSSAGVVLRTIIVEQTLYPMQAIPISTAVLTTGQPANGYQVKRITLSPDTLYAAGDEQALASVEQLFIDSPVDIGGASESFTASVRAKKPAELAYLSTEAITVSVEIEPTPIARTFRDVRLSVRGLGSGLNASLNQKGASVVLEGPQLTLEQLRASKVSGYVDVTDLEAGEYELPVEIHIEDASMDAFDFTATPSTVTVTITEE